MRVVPQTLQQPFVLSSFLFIKGQLVAVVIRRCTAGNDKSDGFPQLPGYCSTNNSRRMDSLLAYERTQRHMNYLCPRQVCPVPNKPPLRTV